MLELQHQTAVLVAGAPGSGETTIARLAARALGAALIDIAAPAAAATAGRDETYHGLLARAAAAAGTGGHVLVAAPFTRERRDPAAWARVEARLRAAGAEAVLVWTRVPEATLLERLT